jgi:hypothetical protein
MIVLALIAAGGSLAAADRDFTESPMATYLGSGFLAPEVCYDLFRI